MCRAASHQDPEFGAGCFLLGFNCPPHAWGERNEWFIAGGRSFCQAGLWFIPRPL